MININGNKITNQRIEWIDYCKTFSCFLVVLGHLIQSLQKANIDPINNITSFINYYIYLFHMPLFLMISGFLYQKTKKKFSLKWYKEFLTKKFFNLMIPYFTFYLIYVGINMFFASSVNSVKGIEDIINMFNAPIAPYWYLYALLSNFMLIPLLEKILKNKKQNVFILFCLLKITSIFINTKIYIIDSIMSWGIYFYFGSFIEEIKINFKNNIILLILYTMLSIGLYLLKESIIPEILAFINILMALGGIILVTNIFKSVKKNKILDTFKNYTFQIYLMHTIFAAGIRIVLLKLGITNYIIHFIFGMIFSIYIPVIISIISDKFEYTNIFIFPTKTIKELRN